MHAALLLRPARGTACKGLCTWAVWDRADLLETAARAGRTRVDPRDDEPAAVRDGTGRTNLFDISIRFRVQSGTTLINRGTTCKGVCF